MTARVTVVPQSSTKEEHREWVERLWSRINRDHDGEISKDELNCDEFQGVLRAILAPNTVGKTVATYGRSEINLQQALDYCLRKADRNNDGVLSFKELEAFLRFLRNETGPEHIADVIFALFDLDNDSKISNNEFRGVYRFYLGHDPTIPDVQEAWSRLDPDGSGFTTKKDFASWLQKDAKPVFRQHAVPVVGSPTPSSSGASVSPKRRNKSSPAIHRPAPGMLPRRAGKKPNFDNVPEWNQRFNVVDQSHQNIAMRGNKRMKSYFMREQSLPELCRFYSTHQGFGDHRRRLLDPDPELLRPNAWPPRRTQPPGASRHSPGGSMRSYSTGEVVPWAENTPRALIRPVWAPGSLLLRQPGAPTPFLMHGREISE